MASILYQTVNEKTSIEVTVTFPDKNNNVLFITDSQGVELCFGFEESEEIAHWILHSIRQNPR